MLSKKSYILSSIELNLFFSRIMKEHCIFIIVGLPSKEKSLIDDANKLKLKYESLMDKFLSVSGGYIEEDTYDSKYLITDYTKRCEEITQRLTGIDINQDITKREEAMKKEEDLTYSSKYEDLINKLNSQAISLTEELINYKSYVLDNILKCKIASTNFPSLFEHIIHEAKHYLKMLKDLQNKKLSTSPENILKEEAFWDEIMKEHCGTTKCLLDPTEKDFISSLDKYFKIFQKLEVSAAKAEKDTIHMLTSETLKDSIGLHKLKSSLVKSSVSCNLKAITVPLFFDHILRENNFYISKLKNFETDIRFEG